MNKLFNAKDLNALDYKDVFIIPQYSEISSRKSIDTSVNLCGLKLDVGVISANMDSVTESATCISMYKAGGIGALHRFMKPYQSIDMVTKAHESGINH